MTKIQNLTKSLATLNLISLSIAGLNFTPSAVATTASLQNTKHTSSKLIAQQVFCSVVNIQTGQLALRSAPTGKSKAGLDNGDTVALLRSGSGVWRYVRVISGPNRAVNGLEGWVNSNYIACNGTNNPAQESCEVVNIQSGQLALRVAPNGKSRAALNNGNMVRSLRGSGVWRYVSVVQGPNRGVNGLEGWVNSNYLSCDG